MRRRHFEKKKISLSETLKEKSPEMGPKWLEMVWNVEKMYREN